MSKTLWLSNTTKNTNESEQVNQFTAGADRTFDLRLAAVDVSASRAHGLMLKSVGLISERDWNLIDAALEEISVEINSGNFVISEGVEDIHSQIEWMLTEKIGEPGKKIHTGRSRNDQILTDLKLYFRNEINSLATLLESVFIRFIQLSNRHQQALMPGYTHFQMAMPSSFGLWFGAYAESLSDDLEMLLTAKNMCNKNPLGSGAGFGSPFPIDRGLTTEILEFNSPHINSVYAQMSRGKTEKFLAWAMSSIAHTLSRFSYDACLYMNQNFDFISFPEHLTTGSSIMPHKKNPDVFELIRARCNRIQAVPNELTLLTNNLPSGYHRDLQLTKEIMFPAIDNLFECLKMMKLMLDNIQIKTSLLDEKKYDLLFTVESVNNLVMQGESFRDAYYATAKSVNDKSFEPVRNINHSHLGSIGNLGNDLIEKKFNALMKTFQSKN